MADNYLERKMEEHRQGASRAPRRRLSPSGQKPGTITMRYPELRVVVTGGASGIGRSIVKAFADAGCRVSFADIDTDAGRATAQATASRFYPVDVADTDAFEAMLNDVAERLGGIDVIVNNAACVSFTPLADLDLAQWDRAMAVNLRPAVIAGRFMARTAADSNNESCRSIINIASTRAAMSEASTEAYSATKGALVSLTHAMMMSLAPLGVRVNCISPGWINTQPESTLRPVDHSFHPSGRVGTPTDIASLCLFLASPSARFINGENITVDGGVTRKMIYPD